MKQILLNKEFQNEKVFLIKLYSQINKFQRTLLWTRYKKNLKNKVILILKKVVALIKVMSFIPLRNRFQNLNKN